MDISESLWIWRLRQIGRKIWFRASFFAFLSVASALIAVAFEPFLPGELGQRIGADSVGEILEILASSMLIVATFSLSTVISAYAAASTATTPRATELLMQDHTAQNALSTFVGGFLFSLVGIIGLRSGIYGQNGHIILFALTIMMVAVIVATFLRWVDLLSRFGRVGDAIDRTAEAAATAMQRLADRPCLGGRPTDDAPDAEHEISVEKMGYVRYIDAAALQEIAEESDGQIIIIAPPGAFLGGTRPIAATTFEPDEETRESIAAAFDIGDHRTFDQDPPYCVSALAEIGIKALSPGVNDPETASRVIDRLVRVLALWRSTSVDTDPRHDRVFAPPLEPDELYAVAFSQLAVYGAGDVRVGVRLQEACRTLSRGADPERADAARRQAERALDLARVALPLQEDVALVEAAGADDG